MKKVILILFLVITGCSNNSIVLECQKTTKDSDLESVETVKSYFKDNALINSELSIKVDFNEYDKDIINNLKTNLLNSFDYLKNTDGVQISSKNLKKGFKINLKIIKNEVDNDTLINLIDLNKDYEDSKKYFISKKYTCK